MGFSKHSFLCVWGRVSPQGWKGKKEAASPHRGPHPTSHVTRIPADAQHRHTHTHAGFPGFRCLSRACAAATPGFLLFPVHPQAHCPGASAVVVSRLPAPCRPSTLGRVPAWPTPSQHPGLASDAISLKRPFLTNCLFLSFPQSGPRDQNSVQATYLEGGPRSTTKRWGNKSDKGHLGAAAPETGRTTPHNVPPVVTGCLP